MIDNCGPADFDYGPNSSSVERVYHIERHNRRGSNRLTLVEFKDEAAADRVASSAAHVEGLLPVPLKVLRFRSRVRNTATKQHQLEYPSHQFSLLNGRELDPNITSYRDLINNNMMSLVALKMRFITLVNLERVLCSGMFSAYELMPFGSSVIDLGSDFGDLDLILTQRRDHQQYISNSLNEAFNRKSAKFRMPDRPEYISNLVHLDKSLYTENRDRAGLKGTMRWFEHVLREYMPLTDGFSVLSVRHAKVPIIKFTARVTAIDCDLSFNLGLDHTENDLLETNYSGILMSQILYSLCRNNPIFAPVSVYLRIFAKLTSITSKEPNIGMTNFQYLSLIIFYLQRISIVQDSNAPGGVRVEPLKSRDKKLVSAIPPFRDLLNPSHPTQAYTLTNEQSELVLSRILTGFFQFYSDLDFSRNALNLYEAKIDRKLDNSCLYVNNPLDRSRNICHNVNRSGLDHFTGQVRTALRGIKASKNENPLTLIRFLLLKDSQQHQQHQQSKRLKLLTFDGSNYDLQTGMGLISETVAEDACR